MIALFTVILLSPLPSGSSSTGSIADVFVDANASNCASGIGTSSDPVCSIGAAVGLAAAGDTIRIAPGTYFENVAISADMNLVGDAGADLTIVDGGNMDSVITIAAAVTVTIDGLTVTGGRADLGAGIRTDGTLTLRNSTVRGNATMGMTGATHQGGSAIGTSDTMSPVDITIESCTIEDNHTVAPSEARGAIFLGGGSLAISNSTIHGNTAKGAFGYGSGGIYVRSSTVLIDQSTLSQNSGFWFGGAFSGWLCDITIRDSTIRDNSSPFAAGIRAVSSLLVVQNSTLSGNVASNRGGALCTYNLRPGSLLSDSTMINNRAYSTAPAACLEGPNLVPLEIRNSIVAGNILSGPSGSQEITGNVLSLGNNLIGTELTGFTDGINGDQVGSSASPLDPLLGPLRFNGGPTQTHAPLVGSPVIDSASTISFEAFDQRGLSRPFGVAPDIGAVESEGQTISFCNGDGGDGLGCTECPCGNNSSPGTIGGCLNNSGSSARLARNGSTSVSLPVDSTIDLRFRMTSAAPNSFALLSSGSAIPPTNPANPCFGSNGGVTFSAFDGLDCTGGGFNRHGTRPTDTLGSVGISNAPWGGEAGPSAGIAGGFIAGQTSYFQVVYRDSAFGVCQAGLNTSQAVEIQFTP